MESRTDMRQMRTIASQFTTRETETEKNPIIEGYFAVFDSIYEMGEGMSESIDAHAFDTALDADIRALTNHDTSLVLGRTKAGTLELRVDEHGLYGIIHINPNDADAMNLYERVLRGDVDQCSFGFDILSEETDFRDDGSVHWTIKEVRLYEVSVCTFPAYSETEVTARSAEKADLEQKKAEAEAEAWRNDMLKKLKGETE